MAVECVVILYRLDKSYKELTNFSNFLKENKAEDLGKFPKNIFHNLKMMKLNILTVSLGGEISYGML